MEDDLFGSSCLFEAFEGKSEAPAIVLESTECESASSNSEDEGGVEVCESSQLVILDEIGPSSQLDSSVDDAKQAPCNPAESLNECDTVSDSGEGRGSQQEEGGVRVCEANVVILDETGSEDDGRSSVEEFAEDGADSDIVVLDEDRDSTTELSSDPSSEKTNGNAAGCQCESCPHLQTVDKLKRENEQLRKQIEEMKSQHRAKTLRLEKLADPQTLDVGTENKCETYSGFCIDKKGLEAVASAAAPDIWRVPSYITSFTDTLNTSKPTEEENSNANQVKSTKSTCFNCLGDHMLNDCIERRDQQRISRNRQDFLNRNGGKQTRYHVENDLRFARFQPGRISEELRNALHLGRKDLPFYIYKMRQLGYPPGWLKEAEISHSGISVYDSEAKGAEGEDGEVKEILPLQVQYDPKLLVGYPGYNVWLPQGVKDEWKRFGFLPLQDHHVRTFSALRKQAKKTKSLKRKRKLSDKHDKKRRRKSGEDMDIEEDGSYQEEPNSAEPLPPGIDPQDSSSEVLNSNGNNDALPLDDPSRAAGSQSPSLGDLESVKLQLMTQLCASSSDSEPQLNHAPAATTSTTEEEPQQPGFSASKFVQMGSPSIFHTSKGSRLPLPPPEKFAAGISEHIPFENLPDSVGKYSTMKQLLQKVRRSRNSL